MLAAARWHSAVLNVVSHCLIWLDSIGRAGTPSIMTTRTRGLDGAVRSRMLEHKCHLSGTQDRQGVDVQRLSSRIHQAVGR